MVDHLGFSSRLVSRGVCPGNISTTSTCRIFVSLSTLYLPSYLALIRLSNFEFHNLDPKFFSDPGVVSSEHEIFAVMGPGVHVLRHVFASISAALYSGRPRLAKPSSLLVQMYPHADNVQVMGKLVFQLIDAH